MPRSAKIKQKRRRKILKIQMSYIVFHTVFSKSLNLFHEFASLKILRSRKALSAANN